MTESIDGMFLKAREVVDLFQKKRLETKEYI